MSGSHSAESSPSADSGFECPCWCVTEHDSVLGEENWVHEGAPIEVEAGVVARLCMSVDPETGLADGPYILVGYRELTIQWAEALGVSFIGLAARGAASSRRAAGGTRSPGP
jgi:hypothetical protein